MFLIKHVNCVMYFTLKLCLELLSSFSLNGIKLATMFIKKNECQTDLIEYFIRHSLSVIYVAICFSFRHIMNIPATFDCH